MFQILECLLKWTFILLMFQRCIVMRPFYISHKQVKMTYSLPRAYGVFCGRFIITVNWDYLYAQKQGKLTSVCLQRFSSVFETLEIALMKSWSLIVYYQQTPDTKLYEQGCVFLLRRGSISKLVMTYVLYDQLTVTVWTGTRSWLVLPAPLSLGPSMYTQYCVKLTL